MRKFDGVVVVFFFSSRNIFELKQFQWPPKWVWFSFLFLSACIINVKKPSKTHTHTKNDNIATILYLEFFIFILLIARVFEFNRVGINTTNLAPPLPIPNCFSMVGHSIFFCLPYTICTWFFMLCFTFIRIFFFS